MVERESEGKIVVSFNIVLVHSLEKSMGTCGSLRFLVSHIRECKSVERCRFQVGSSRINTDLKKSIYCGNVL